MNVIDLLQEIGVHPKRVASSKGGEYHSPCPDPGCDGRDRFCAWPNEGLDGRYWCRQCLRAGDAIQFCRDFMGLDFASACSKVGRKLPVSTYAKKGNKIEHFIPKHIEQPLNNWNQRAIAFVDNGHQYLLKNSHLLNLSKDRGLNLESIVNFKLGWNSNSVFESRETWGLISDEGGQSLCLPQGIIIPTFRDNILFNIKIRRHNWMPEQIYPKYHLVAGGKACPSIYGERGKPLVIVEAELDGMLVHTIAKDLCCCIALGGASNRPDKVSDELIRKTSIVLFALDFDEAGKKAYQFWRSTYPHIKPWPVPRGKSPGDAYALGVNLRSWIDSGLKGGI